MNPNLGLCPTDRNRSRMAGDHGEVTCYLVLGTLYLVPDTLSLPLPYEDQTSMYCTMLHPHIYRLGYRHCPRMENKSQYQGAIYSSGTVW